MTTRCKSQLRRVQRQQRARIAQGVLQSLDQSLNGLATRATTTKWGERVAAIAGELGMLASVEIDDAAGRRDRPAWDRLKQLLGSADRLWATSDNRLRNSIWQSFSKCCSTCSGWKRFPARPTRPAACECSRPAAPRALSIPYLFFAGLSEKAFPPPEREDRMYGETEYQQLAKYDLPFVLRAEQPGRDVAVL